MCLYEINDAAKYALYFFPIGFAISSLWGLTEEYFLLVVEKKEVFFIVFSLFLFFPSFPIEPMTVFPRNWSIIREVYF